MSIGRAVNSTVGRIVRSGGQQVADTVCCGCGCSCATCAGGTSLGVATVVAADIDYTTCYGQCIYMGLGDFRDGDFEDISLYFQLATDPNGTYTLGQDVAGTFGTICCNWEAFVAYPDIGGFAEFYFAATCYSSTPTDGISNSGAWTLIKTATKWVLAFVAALEINLAASPSYFVRVPTYLFYGELDTFDGDDCSVSLEFTNSLTCGMFSSPYLTGLGFDVSYSTDSGSTWTTVIAGGPAYTTDGTATAVFST